MKKSAARVLAVRPDSSPNLLQRVFRLRYRVYVEEMGLPLAGDADAGLSDPADETATSFLCEVDGEDVGTLRFVGIRDRPLELFEQSPHWQQTIVAATRHRDGYFEINRFMVVRSARRGDAAVRLVNAVFQHAVANRYRDGFIAAKRGRLLDYYKRFYRGRQLSDTTTPYTLDGQVLGHYHLMRFDLGDPWSLRRLGLNLYYRALTLAATHLRPLVSLAIRRRSGFSAGATFRDFPTDPSRHALQG